MAAAAPTLQLSADLEALVPAVAAVVATSTRGIVHPSRLARELLRFLHLKVLMEDMGALCALSPPLLIDAAWHALLLETALLANVNEALGVAAVHHSAQQPGGDAAHEARLLFTLSAALHVENWQGGGGGGGGDDDGNDAAAATPLSTLPPLLWGSPPHGSVLVRVVLLPLGQLSPRALHTYMPPHANIQDLAAQLQRLSGITPERFRAGSPDSIPLHPTRLLSGLPAAQDSSLRLFAAAAMAAQPTPAKRGRPVSLNLNGRQRAGLNGRAPLHSLLPPAAPTAYFNQYQTDAEGQPAGIAVLDDTRPLAEFDGATLYTRLTEGGTTTLPVTLSCPQADTPGLLRQVPLPEAWALADVQAWAGKLPGGPHTLLVGGAPPPAGFSHTSAPSSGAVELLVRASVVAGMELSVKTLTGKTLSLRCTMTDTVLDLMFDIERREGIPVDQQRLIFAGRQLESTVMLCEYNLWGGSILHLVLRLGGC